MNSVLRQLIQKKLSALIGMPVAVATVKKSEELGANAIQTGILCKDAESEIPLELKEVSMIYYPMLTLSNRENLPDAIIVLK